MNENKRVLRDVLQKNLIAISDTTGNSSSLAFNLTNFHFNCKET